MTPRPVRPSELDHLAEEIRYQHGLVQQAFKMSLEHACRAGQLLLEAKGALLHGEYLPFLAKKAMLPPRTAQVYTKLFRA